MDVIIIVLNLMLPAFVVFKRKVGKCHSSVGLGRKTWNVRSRLETGNSRPRAYSKCGV